MSRLIRQFPIVVLLLLALTIAVHAGPKDPISGDQFQVLLEAQNTELQDHLASVFPEDDGYFIAGPLNPLFEGSEKITPLYHSIRVICLNLAHLEQTIESSQSAKRFKKLKTDLGEARKKEPAGYRGAMATLVWRGSETNVQLITVNQLRWLIWAQDSRVEIGDDTKAFRKYAQAVSDYLYALDRGLADATEPKAVESGLSESLDFYATPPDYVIEGYQNYKDFLYAHASINTDFVQGVTAFVPDDSLLDELAQHPPQEAYPNKEAAMLQHEYRKFFARAGDLTQIRTLKPADMESLVPGEHFFGVGLSGKVRFGREIPREEIERIETTTGKKVPRANHALLFPGEPLLTAGAFFVDDKPAPRITHINAQSGHYFYSNISATIREDISKRSDHYILTVGHFIEALKRLRISYDSVLISKL